jgi:Aldo/keto reductase family
MPMLCFSASHTDKDQATAAVSKALENGFTGVVCDVDSKYLHEIGAALSKCSGKQGQIFTALTVRGRVLHHSATCVRDTALHFRSSFPVWLRPHSQHRRLMFPCRVSVCVLRCSIRESSVLQVSGPTAAPEHAAQRVEQSIRNLGVRAVNLVLVEASDRTAATWATLEPLVESGVILSLGLAGATLEQTVGLAEGVSVMPVVNLVELHPLHSQRKMVGHLLRKVWNVSQWCIKAVLRGAADGRNMTPQAQKASMCMLASEASTADAGSATGCAVRCGRCKWLGGAAEAGSGGAGGTREWARRG